MLGRDTDWRQGDLLSASAAIDLGLILPEDASRRVIVISHDCDLPHEAEEFVEVLIAQIVERADPNFSHAKNPRRLHLAFERSAEARLILELRHANRRNVPMPDFAARAKRDLAVRLSVEGKRTLKQWLAARYGRPAFPNALENRLRKEVGQRTVEQCIARILDPAARYLVGVFFDLGEQRHVELPDGDPYSLRIALVYDATEDGPEARRAAEAAAERVRALFEEAYGRPEVATEITLESCEAVADAMMTLADLRRVDMWRLEYVSLRDEDAGDFLPVGQLPG